VLADPACCLDAKDLLRVDFLDETVGGLDSVAPDELVLPLSDRGLGAADSDILLPQAPTGLDLAAAADVRCPREKTKKKTIP
jgi:hypothetical protein